MAPFDFGKTLGGGAGAPAPAPAPEPEAADPASLVDQIQGLLDQLREAIAPAPAPEPTEFEPQSDEEVMAGIPKKPKGGFNASRK